MMVPYSPPFFREPEVSVMRKKIVFFILVFVLPALPAAATADFNAAGVLLVTGAGQPSLVLLVKHRSRSWYEMPGGRRQLQSAGERGPDGAYETAIRECHEESRGMLSRELLREAVDPARQLRDGGFVFFVGRVDPVALDSLRQAPVPEAAAFREIEDYAWVAIESVLASDDNTVIDAEGRRIQVRPQLKPRLNGARAKGWL
jgi:8-oxo-dGTP pyrophosphatase MutT (NUDIX family)